MKIISSLLLLISVLFVNAQTTTVTGRLFYDVNGNQIYDGSDSVLEGRLVRATYSGGEYNTTTDVNGLYTLLLPPESYFFGFVGDFDYANYTSWEYLNKVYTTGGTDIVNFAFQKRSNIESLRAYFNTSFGDQIPLSGATKTVTLSYGYDGGAQQIPAKLSIKYNPKVIITNTSIPPTITSSGFMEWTLPNVQCNLFFNDPLDSIVFTIQFPAVGDTIGNFVIAPNFIPQISYTPSATNSIYKYFQYY
ncbi:MAG: hypothetical protein ACOYKE_04065, partial [Ferruginibacter sp.]